MKTIDPNKIWVGDVVLVATGTDITIKVQKKLNYGDSSQWTHVAGSIGGYDLVEGQIPKSRVRNLQKDYVEQGMTIKVMRKKFEKDSDRIKVALWWATMNNTPYDYFQLVWFPAIRSRLSPEIRVRLYCENQSKYHRLPPEPGVWCLLFCRF